MSIKKFLAHFFVALLSISVQHSVSAVVVLKCFINKVEVEEDADGNGLRILEVVGHANSWMTRLEHRERGTFKQKCGVLLLEAEMTGDW